MENLEKLKTLQTMLGCEKFILTGSNAVALHGIATGKKADDLDIILVKPTESAKDVLQRLQEANPNPKFTGKGSLTYSFFFEKVKVDIWVKADIGKEDSNLSYEGITVASLRTIVAAKRSYNRPKDFIQLMQWAASIFNRQNFDVSTISTDDWSDYPGEEQSVPMPKS